jgi:hypothetical protein
VESKKSFSHWSFRCGQYQKNIDMQKFRPPDCTPRKSAALFIHHGFNVDSVMHDGRTVPEYGARIIVYTKEIFNFSLSSILNAIGT